MENVLSVMGGYVLGVVTGWHLVWRVADGVVQGKMEVTCVEAESEGREADRTQHEDSPEGACTASPVRVSFCVEGENNHAAGWVARCIHCARSNWYYYRRSPAIWNYARAEDFVRRVDTA